MSRRIFSRIFSPNFLNFSPHFCWKKVSRKILQENPRENPPKFKILQHISADCPGQHLLGNLKITSTSTERQKRSQNLAPVPEVIPGNSLVFSRKIITSTGLYRCCAPGASAPVVVRNQSPIFSSPIPVSIGSDVLRVWEEGFDHQKVCFETAAVISAKKPKLSKQGSTPTLGCGVCETKSKKGHFRQRKSFIG